MKTSTTKTASRQKSPEAISKDIAATYNEFKEFEGKKYTGMKIGRSHRWHYDEGEWRETKITPDLWQITYAVHKHRHGKAPEGSGVPVGTEYHWYILAHQNVTKLNANVYSTSMTGLKYKLAHRRADSGKWSASENARRRKLAKMLHELAAELEAGPVELEFKPTPGGQANGKQNGRTSAKSNGRARTATRKTTAKKATRKRKREMAEA